MITRMKIRPKLLVSEAKARPPTPFSLSTEFLIFFRMSVWQEDEKQGLQNSGRFSGFCEWRENINTENIDCYFLKKNEYPWVVSLMDRDGHFCGGALIASKYVLTAGHCMIHSTDNNFQVRG